MKKVIFGSALLLSGIILASVSMLGANLSSGNGLFNILFLVGIVFAIIGIGYGLVGLSENK